MFCSQFGIAMKWCSIKLQVLQREHMGHAGAQIPDAANTFSKLIAKTSMPCSQQEQWEQTPTLMLESVHDFRAAVP